jgi:predicted porin
MKKSLLAVILAAATTVVSAQSNVTIYGLIDAGMRYDSKANAQDDSKTVAISGVQSTSRLGFRGSEDLGNGNKANFLIEAGFNPTSGTGSQNGSTGTVTFDRLAWVGLSNRTLGEVQLGRNTNATADFSSISDPLSFALDGVGAPVVVNNATYNTAGIRINQQIGITANTNGTRSTRSDGMIKYLKTFGAVNVIAGYSAGGVAGTDNKGAYSLGASIKQGPVRASAATMQAQDTAGKKLDVNSFGFLLDVTNVMTVITGYHTAKTEAGFVPTHLTTTTTAQGPILGLTTTSGPSTDHNVKNIGVRYQVSPALTSTVAYYKGDYTNGVGKAGKLDTYVLLNSYALSKRTNLYGIVDYAKAQGDITSSSVSDTNIGFTVGMRHSF